MTIKSNGNIILTGMFQGTIQLGSNTLTSAGLADLFIAELTPSGTVLWAIRAGDTSYDNVFAVQCDAAGNIYIAGEFQNFTTIGATTLVSFYGWECFIARFDPTGNPVWATSMGSSSTEGVAAMDIDTAGNLYLCGTYSDTFIAGAHTQTAAGTQDIWLAKYDSSGNCLWLKSAGGTSVDVPHSLCLDESSNIYLTGYFAGSASFDHVTLNTFGSGDIFIAKYNSSGIITWATKAGGPGFDHGFTMDYNANSLYVAGYFSTTASFDALSISSTGTSDIFIAKYDTAGAVTWVRNAGGPTAELSRGIWVNHLGNACVVGSFKGTVTFGSYSATSYSAANDVYAAAFDASGNALWLVSATGPGEDAAYDVTGNQAGDLYICGIYSDTITFGSTSLLPFGPDHNSDLFVAKLSGSLLGVPNQQNGAAVMIAPNPFTHSAAIITDKSLHNSLLTVYDVTGREAMRAVILENTRLERGTLPSGMYFYRITDEGKVVSAGKLVIE